MTPACSSDSELELPLMKLCGCEGRSMPLLFACQQNQIGQCTRFRYLSHRPAANAQSSLRTHAQTRQRHRYSPAQSMDVRKGLD